MRLVAVAILLGFPLLEAVVWCACRDARWWCLAWVVLAACAGIALIKEARFAMLARLARPGPGPLLDRRASPTAPAPSSPGPARLPRRGLGPHRAHAAAVPGPRMVTEPSARRRSGGTLIEGEFRRTR
jgi:UPF0716 protein FxsA